MTIHELKKAEVVDAAVLLTSVFEMAGFAARRAGVQLTVDVPYRDLRFCGDRTHLLQTLVDLVTNAIDAVGPGGLVAVAAWPSDGPDVVLEIAAIGPETPPGIELRIWEPFFAPKRQGPGAGMALARSRITEMGGMVEIETGPHRGTRCRLAFRQMCHASART